MNIGFMQGRLCDRVDGKIQAFPWRDWESEFPAAEALGISLIEWTLDQDRLYENPLMTAAGRERIRDLSARHHVDVQSLTGDCFMQEPFYKAEGAKRERLIRDLHAVIAACAEVGIRYVVIPLVDNGHLDNEAQEDLLLSTLLSQADFLERHGMYIVFESDLPPSELKTLIGRFPSQCFGINYDIGNSAALGYEPAEEIAAYGDRIVNVHVKDRLPHGTTVPLGSGAADFRSVFSALRQAGYRGDFILQTARAEDDDHAGVLARYRDMTKGWINESGS